MKTIPLFKCLEQHKVTEHFSEPEKEVFVTVSGGAHGVKQRNIKEGKTPVPFDGYRIRKGMFIYSKIGAGDGAYGIVPSELDRAVVSKDFPVFLIKEDVVLPEYLLLCVSSPTFWEKSKKHSNGALLKRLKEEQLLSFEIPLPSIAEQRKYASFFKCLNGNISKTEKLVSLLDEQVKSLFNEAFPESKYSSRALISCCLDKDDVKCGPFGTQLSHDEYQTEGIPLYEIAQISSRFGKMPVNFLTVEKAKKLSQYSLLPGDIAMSRKGRVGDCVVVPQHFDEGVIHSDVVRIRSNPRILLSEFLACQFINSEKLQASVNQVSSGAIMPGINVTKLKNVEVECPPIGIQKEFVERLHRIDKLRFNYQRQIEVLQELLDKKMEEYFGGENDEL